MNKYIIEGIGTFFLCLVVALTGNPIAIGAVLCAMVYMGGYISGGHYNPAVTLAVWIRGKIEAREAKMYAISQVVGAIIAALVYFTIKSSTFVPTPGKNVDFIASLLVEILFTFALATTVLHTATSDKTKNNQYYGLAIGLTLMAGAFAGGAISGGVYNPAIGLGTILVDLGNLSANIPHLLLYLIGPLTGGTLAGMVFNTVTQSKNV